MIPNTKYWVTRPEKTRKDGIRPSSYIPTIGHITSVFDVYRTAGIHSITNRPDSWSVTDIESVSALGRVIDGPIASKDDIAKAESAIRAALLYDFAEVFVPSLKIDYGNGFISYERLDKDIRNQASFEGFSCVPCRDQLLAAEFLTVKDGQILTSSNEDTKLIGKSIEDSNFCLNYVREITADISVSLALDYKATSHFSDRLFTNADRSASGFIDSMYDRIELSWDKKLASIPKLSFNATLPPLISIVLFRANQRSDIPNVLRELREEMEVVRNQLNDINQVLESGSSEADIASFVQKYSESFDAIVPEAFLTNAQRNKRKIIEIFNFIRPIRSIYSLVADPLNIDREKLFEVVSQIEKVVSTDSRIIARSVAAEKMSDLLRVESLHNCIKTHFNESELKLFK